MPLVSVIMLSYNHKDYIDSAINSVLNQSFQDWELIIIDDASTDGSQQLIKNLSENDDRIKVIYHETNQGIASSTNEGIEAAKSKFIAFLDSDDIWHTDKLLMQITLLKEDDNTVIWSEGEIIDESGSLMERKFTELHGAQDKKKTGDILESLIEGNYIFQSSFIIKKENLRGIKFNEDLKYLNDYQFVVDLAKKYKFKFINKALAKYRVHSSSTVRRDPGGYASDEIKLRAYFIRNFSKDVSDDVIFSNHARIVDLLGRKIFDLSSQVDLLNKEKLDLSSQVDLLNKEKFDLSSQLQNSKNELSAMKRSFVWQLLMVYHNNVACCAFPVGSRRRRGYDLGIIGCRILVNEGFYKFAAKFRDYLRNKSYKIYKKYLPTVLSIIIVLNHDLKKNKYLEQRIVHNMPGIEYLVLNYAGDIHHIDKLKIIENNRELSFSEALNAAVRYCSGSHILIINEKVLDDGNLSFLLKIFYRKKINFNILNLKESPGLSDVFFSEKEWVEQIGGFDDHFRGSHYINNDLDFSVNNLNYKMDILNRACLMFNASFEKIKCLKKSANSVYECQINNERCILRIIERPLEYVSLVSGEIEWVNFLGDNGINVCRAIPSIKGNYVEAIQGSNSWFLASSFQMAKGYHIDLNDLHMGDDLLFQKWGETLGKMHSLSKNYIIEDTTTKRNDWNYGPLFNSDLDLGPGNNKVLKIWRAILNEMESLPKDKNSYGLVHNDFHHRNFLIDRSKIIVIDFDDCAFNWFACDIAISLYHAISAFPIDKKSEFENILIKNFMKGYSHENVLNEYWISLIPKFLKFREIYTYLFFYTTLNASQRDTLKALKHLIENEVPCANFSFNNIQ